MEYLDVISLTEAKKYLRIDDGMTEDDAIITSMILASITYVESVTNYKLYDRTESYVFNNGQVRVYDFPISTPFQPNDVTLEINTLYTTFYHSTATHLGLYVGYQRKEDIPADLIMVVYEVLDLLYYSEKGGESVEKRLSELSKMVLNSKRRFII